MTDHKFTDDDVIKAYELCFTPKGTNETCAKCPFHKIGLLCKIERDRAALDLLHRQKNALDREIYNGLKADEEIEYLKAEVEGLKEEGNKYPCRVRMNENSIVRTKSLEDYDRLIGDISAEAIKEFAERLKGKAEFTTIAGYRDYGRLINDLVKEMTEEQTNESQST